MAETQGSTGPGEEYVVVARRYRPQSFEDLVGQSQVAQALSNAITTNRVGHAYLFTGARGVGKTSSARIFAKCLNCVRGPTTHPCGECDICRSIAAGEDVDVLEIDGASNRGIDEIRQLRSNVNVRPSRARFKVYIIDEVHMLTMPAFNALLKTLEEPPEHVKFIFCTTEADKIPITVLSRCQRFDFSPLETKSILDRLQLICQNEGVEAEPEALQILARRAAGSMRDSQSLLEQLLSFGGKQITVAEVHGMLGTAKTSRLSAIARAIVERNAAEALQQLDGAASEGVDLGQLTEQLIGYFRDMMAALVGCPADLLLNTSTADLPELNQFGDQLGLETILAIVQILDQTLSRLRQSTHVRTLVEIGLVRVCRLEDLDQLPQLVAQLHGGAPPAGRPAAGAAARPISASLPPRASAPASSPAVSSPSASPSVASSPVAEKKTPDVSSSIASPSAEPSPAPAFNPANLPEIWRQALAELGDMTSDFASKAESIAISGPNRLVARFRKAYNQAVTFCERPERKARLEEALARIAGQPLRIEFTLLPDEPTTVAQPARPVPTQANRRKRMREVERNPMIRQAIELFDAEVVDVIEPARPEGDEESPGAQVGDDAS